MQAPPCRHEQQQREPGDPDRKDCSEARATNGALHGRSVEGGAPVAAHLARGQTQPENCRQQGQGGGEYERDVQTVRRARHDLQPVPKQHEVGAPAEDHHQARKMNHANDGKDYNHG